LLVFCCFSCCCWSAALHGFGKLINTSKTGLVRVVRDEQGVPYIFAQSLDDVFRAQGFVTAQDRLFQLELNRYLAHGRLAELIGEPGLGMDVRVRVAGIPRHAQRHAALLRGEEKRRRELYLEGMNAYILEHADEHPVALRLMGITPQPWTLEDSVTLSYFLNLVSSANLVAEAISQAIVDKVGPERAAEITQLTVNPDDESERAGRPVQLTRLDALLTSGTACAVDTPRCAAAAGRPAGERAVAVAPRQQRLGRERCPLSRRRSDRRQ